MTDITIYHNPKCGTSRSTLELIRQTGTEPRVIHYLETPPTPVELSALISNSGLSVREMMRAKEPLYASLDLGNPKWSDDELVNFMLANPILINRPIVVTPLGTRLCRPAETVLALLSKAG